MQALSLHPKMKSRERKKERNQDRAFAQKNRLIQGQLYRYVGHTICARVFADPHTSHPAGSEMGYVSETDLLMFLGWYDHVENGNVQKIVKVIWNDVVGYLVLPVNVKSEIAHRWLRRAKASDFTDGGLIR